MPPKKEEEKKDELLDDLDKLDGDPEPEPEGDPEPELSIVDQFVAGDMEAVKQSIQDQVIKAVSDTVNGTPEPDADPEPDPDPED